MFATAFIDVDDSRSVGLPTRWSPSALNDFLKCPLAYWFKYAQSWRPRPNEALSTGSLIHEILEQFMALEPEQRTRDAARALFTDRFDDLVAGPPHGVDLSEVHALAGSAMRHYFDLEQPELVDVIPNGLERAVAATIDDVPVRGSIDRVEFGIGGARILDYKTGAAKPRYAGPYWRQQLLYAAMMDDEGISVTEVALLYLGPVPRLLRRPTPPTALSRVTADLSGAAADREAYDQVSQWQARESTLCGHCPYRRACPLLTRRAPVPGTADSDHRLATSLRLRRATTSAPEREDIGDPEVAP